MLLITEMDWNSVDLSESLGKPYNDGLLQKENLPYFLFGL